MTDTDQCDRCPETLPDNPLHLENGDRLCAKCEAIYDAKETQPDTYPMPEHGWCCFHCGDTFHSVKEARLHFGTDITDEPGCVLKLRGDDKGLLALVRLQYAELDQFRLEDQPIMRELYSLGAEHSRKLIEAEELGYARGLRDARLLDAETK